MRLRSARGQAVLTVAVASTAAAVVRWFPPSHYSFYPTCPIQALFGISCPGCGATRALEAMLHARWAEAAHFNLLVVALAPGLAALAAMEIYSALRWDCWRPVPVSPFAAKCLLTIAVLFGFARNMEPLFRGFR